MSQAESLKFPKLRGGYLLASLSFLLLIMSNIMIAVLNLKDWTANPVAVVFTVSGFICGFVTWIYWFINVHRFHKIVSEVTQQSYPITPGRSVGYQFIPFFNIFWMFKWPSELAEFVNHIKGDKVINKWAPGWYFLLAGIVSRLLGALGLIIDFMVLSYLIKKTKAALNDTTFPINYSKKKYKVNAVWLWLAVLIPIIGLVAAIAIPNLVASRNMARQKTTTVTLQTP